MVYIAYGSICEMETQNLLAGDLGYIENANLDSIKDEIAEVERMLKGLIPSLRTKDSMT